VYLDAIRAEEVRWQKDAPKGQRIINSFIQKKYIHQIERVFCTSENNVNSWMQFVCDRTSYMVLIGRWWVWYHCSEEARTD